MIESGKEKFRKCSVPGCQNPVKKGNYFLCKMHENSPNDICIYEHGNLFSHSNSTVGKS